MGIDLPSSRLTAANQKIQWVVPKEEVRGWNCGSPRLLVVAVFVDETTKL